jgi:predicted ester cyclase
MIDSISLVTGYLAAGDAGELDVLGRYLHDDVVVHNPNGITTTGLEHEKETWWSARSAMPGLRHHIREVVNSGSVVAARITVSGMLRGTFAGVSADGRAFEIDQAIFMHIADGKVEEMWVIVDTGRFYREMGTLPE